MPLIEYTYKRQGVTLSYLSRQVPGSGGSVGDQMPPAYQLVTWDSAYKEDLDAAMASAGWEYLWQGPPPAAKTLVQTQTAALAADGSSIGVGAGWQDIGLSRTLTTRGGSTVSVQVTAIGNPSTAPGQVRVLINGGSFSDTIVGASAYDIPNSVAGTTTLNAPLLIPDTSPDETTYTFKLQMQAPGALNAIIPKAHTRIGLVEHR